MANTTILRKKRAKSLEKKVQQLVDEVQKLRLEIYLSSLPEEDLEEYAHPDRILRSRAEALKRYPSKR